MLKSFFNWKVLLNILLAAVVFVGLIWLTFRWLEYHTKHGEEIPVPNVMNMSVHNAINAIEDAGLSYEVDSLQFNPKFKPFQVLGIYPKPGSRVKEGRPIRITVNPRSWAKVTVPDILDRYKGLAFRQLEQLGLKVGDTIFEPNIARDAVIRMQMNGQVLKPGVQVPRFSVIDLIIGTGPKRNVPVPNVVGLTVAEAERIIVQNLFEVGLVEFEDGKGDKSDIIYYQDPEGGALRDQGNQIDLWASKKTPGQMSAQIRNLNNIYRMKVDTTLPPIRYEEEIFYPEPVAPPVPKPVTPKPTPTPAPTQEKEKPKTTTPTATASSGAAKPKTTEKPKTEEKPKVKKVVVE